MPPPTAVGTFLDDTQPLKLTYTGAWILQATIKPGFKLDAGHPAREYQDCQCRLREKVNHALLRFADEENLEEVTIDINLNECWMIDSVLNYDGNDGHNRNTLIQVFRALWAFEHSIGLSAEGFDQEEWNRRKERLAIWRKREGLDGGEQAIV